MGHTYLYKLSGVQMFVLYLYDVFTAMKYVHQIALLAVPGFHQRRLFCSLTKRMYCNILCSVSSVSKYGLRK